MRVEASTVPTTTWYECTQTPEMAAEYNRQLAPITSPLASALSLLTEWTTTRLEARQTTTSTVEGGEGVGQEGGQVRQAAVHMREEWGGRDGRGCRVGGERLKRKKWRWGPPHRQRRLGEEGEEVRPWMRWG